MTITSDVLRYDTQAMTEVKTPKQRKPTQPKGARPATVAPKPTRRERAQATRRRIMRAAYERFCDQGYAGATMACNSRNTHRISTS